MTPFFSSISHASPKRLLLASLLLCPGLAMAAAFSPFAEGLAMGSLVGMEGNAFGSLRSNRWCMLYRTQGSLQILDGNACDVPQIGLVRQFD